MPAETRSKSENKMSQSILELFSEGANITSKKQLEEKIGNADLNDILFAILVTHRASLDRVGVLEKRVAELEDQIKHDQSRLEDSILRQEAYSGRNTVILAGIPELETETSDSIEPVSYTHLTLPTILRV